MTLISARGSEDLFLWGNALVLSIDMFAAPVTSNTVDNRIIVEDVSVSRPRELIRHYLERLVESTHSARRRLGAHNEHVVEMRFADQSRE